MSNTLSSGGERCTMPRDKTKENSTGKGSYITAGFSSGGELESMPKAFFTILEHLEESGTPLLLFILPPW